ncbi:replication initiator [Actinoplanes sp. NPDC023714]|uniref:replication initiator n=1 Tax=Actinoplanes sp. NPDC023714 TaxID=3154322 RepID=UPI0033C1AD3B
MSTSTLDLVPREQTARGTGSNAEPAWTPPPAACTATGQALTRATRPGYFDWLDHVRAAGGCTRPIRLTGTLSTIEATTGRLLDARHTDQLPDAAIYKACGTRLASVCPACARVYQADAYQILRSLLIGGKGIPASVAKHPAAFPTFTAPSFGTVHARVVKHHTCANRKRCTCRAEPCHARRDTGACEHGNPAVCWRRHEPDDPVLGHPLCLDCYDHDHHVVWNAFSTELWHRTKQAADRYLHQLCRSRGLASVLVPIGDGKLRRKPPVQLTHGKVAELQRRAVVHFHAEIRLDGVHPTDPDTILQPPPGISPEDIADAFRHAVTTIAFRTPAHPDRPDGWEIRWGDVDKGFDIDTFTLAADDTITDASVAEHIASRRAGYLAKYATKSTEETGFSSTRITADTIDDYADPDGDHHARLIDACWRIGRPTHTPAALAGRPVRHPDPGERRVFDTPWDCPDCGTHTRYAACPVCAAERQASLDTKPASTAPPNPYARLRRYAHRFGFNGHFLTKTRRRVVRFQTLRDDRINFRRAADQADTSTIRAVDHLDETTLIVGTLTFAGVGWHNSGDALLANTAAAQARERQTIGREELAHEIGSAASCTDPIAA